MCMNSQILDEVINTTTKGSRRGQSNSQTEQPFYSATVTKSNLKYWDMGTEAGKNKETKSYWVCIAFFGTWVCRQSCLARRQSGGVNNVGGILLGFLALLRQRRTGQSHETGPSRLENTEGTDQLEERVDTARLGRPGLFQVRTGSSNKYTQRTVLTVPQCSCCY